jgi:hypothetical protein
MTGDAGTARGQAVDFNFYCVSGFKGRAQELTISWGSKKIAISRRALVGLSLP